MMGYFISIFDMSVMSWIVQKTNECRQFLENWGNLSQREHSNKQDWHDVTIAEMYVWIALTMLMPHTKKHRLVDYWSTEDLLSTPIFGRYMSRDRYRGILNTIHFSSNMGPHPNDRLWKIRPIMSMLLQNMQAYFRPFQNLVIDESLVLFKGRVAFTKYIPSKRHRLGIKFYVICDCQTGYVLDFVVYTGTDVDIAQNDPLGFSGAVVKHLMVNFLGKNHILYTDNYYTSPILSQYLKEHRTESCGTVHATRNGFPTFPNTQRGDCVKKKSGNILALKWHDKRPVHMLTTIHKGEMVDSGKVEHGTCNSILKPDAVLDYNVNMRFVDRSDLMVSTIDCLRKSSTWYRKVFLHLIDICMMNAYILYQQQHQGTKTSLRQFEKTVVKEILMTYGRQGNPTAGEQPDRLQARDWAGIHRLTEVPLLASGRPAFRRCRACLHTTRRPARRKETRFWCTGCRVALCPGNCYTDYHTLDVI